METLAIPSDSSKDQIYRAILPQIKELISQESDMVANMSNIVAVLKETFNFLWVGFYIVKQSSNNNLELVLGPFQGPIACTRINLGKGVCGTAWKENRTLVVPDVDKFTGHIACSSLSRSEIVVPVVHLQNVIAVLDIDSKDLDTFDSTDEKYLNEMLTYFSSILN